MAAFGRCSNGGWASVAEYRYHRPLPAYLNLRANAQLIFDGALGRATEVLSGRYYTQLVTSSSHQIWSSAMIVSPMLRGMFGLTVDAPKHSVTFAPHIPAGWTDFAIHHVQVGKSSLDLAVHRSNEELTLTVDRQGSDDVQLEFSPAFSLRTEMLGASVNNARVALKAAGQSNDEDQHVTQTVQVAPGKTVISLRYRDDFGIAYPYAPPALGAPSTSLKIFSETWNAGHDRLDLQVAGVGGAKYEVPLFGDLHGLTAMGGALDHRGAQTFLQLAFPAGAPDGFTTKSARYSFLSGKA